MSQRILNDLSMGPIRGLEDVKLALLCMAVDRNIRGLLIRGPSGVGKTAVMRAVAECAMDSEPVNLPINTTEAQVYGSLDIESALESGKATLSPGLLHRANGTFLCIDDINLFDRRFVRALMGTVIDGNVRVEREGISGSYTCDTSVVATMNLRETVLGSAVSDLFDMSVTVHGSDDPGFRADVVRINLDGAVHDRVREWGDVCDRVHEARELMPHVLVPDNILRLISESSSEFGCPGHRGEISSVRVAMSLAALDGRTTVSRGDAVSAMKLCLGHRRQRNAVSKKEEPKDVVNFYSDSHMRRFIHDERNSSPETDAKVAEVAVVEGLSETGPCVDDEEVPIEIGEMFDSIDLKEEILRSEKLDANLMRKSIRDVGRDGRYVSARHVSEISPDIAVDATIRAAAPFQRMRRSDDDSRSIIIERQDLMEKVREKRTSCMFLFMIDTSGSLIIRGRMRAVKAAILSMLSDHYVRRDSVGIMEFNEAHVGMVLPATQSVGGIRKVLDDINVGKKTPLSEALAYSRNYVSSYVRTHPAETCFVVIMTDGLANMALEEGRDPFEEALSIAKAMDVPRTKWVVVDTAAAPGDRTNSRILSEALKGLYYKLDDLHSSDGILHNRPSG